MSPLANEIVDKTPWLLSDLGFHIVSDQYSPEVFGNCLVVLNGPQLRLRMVRDRGQILAYLAAFADPDRWWDLDFVLEAISGHMPAPNFELEAVGGRLQANFPALVDALGPKLEQTRCELERRRQLRLRALRDRSRMVDEGKPTWRQRIFGN